jgi:uncharacterized cupredoxin-like copper-binding protein
MMTMNASQFRKVALAVGLIAGLGASAVFAAQTGTTGATITVTLWDKGPDSATPDDAHPMGYGSKGADMAMAMLGVKADVTTVPAGKVTFNVTNASKDIVHEMLVSPLPADGQLPYVAAEYRVDEEAAGHLGEVSELDPGQTGSLTLDLTPGKYILFCNIPAHFMNGMWTVVTVQ